MRFEDAHALRTCIGNYCYLHWLDEADRASADSVTRALRVRDVGSGNFWYAAALDAFFRPRWLRGAEIDSNRRYWNGYLRRDAAAGYLARLPHAAIDYLDYASLEESVDCVTCFFPFVTRASVIGWGLPHNILNPQGLFSRVRSNLRPGGIFFMLNHGREEFEIAQGYAEKASLRRAWQSGPLTLLAPRSQAPWASCWHA